MTTAAPTDHPPEARDYFEGYTDGRYCPLSQLDFIYPEREISPSEDGQVLHIGRPGVDGLQFSYRRGHPGIWVWYPLDHRWVRVAADISTLERDWLSGHLTV